MSIPRMLLGILCALIVAPSESPALATASSKYHYPASNTFEVATTSAIGLSTPSPVVRTTIPSITLFGASSRYVQASWHLNADRTMILIGHEPFQTNERVTVSVAADLEDGSKFSDRFSFTTTINPPQTLTADAERAYTLEGYHAPTAPEHFKHGLFTAASEDSTGLPPLTVVADANPTRGTIYLSNFSFFGASPANGQYLLELDEHGNVLKQQALPGNHAQDFKRQPNGLLTYYDYSKARFYGLDTNFVIVDSFEASSDISTDGHELRILPNGGYLILGQSITEMDMTQRVAGGFSNAMVLGSVIEEFDKDRNLIFQWRGIDHFNVLEATHEVLTESQIDFEHANAIEIDLDSNILLSSRHLSEITKIDRNTGEIIWRLGGVHNQFTWTNDTLGISYQHAIRVLPNGHYTLFDNGNYHPIQESRALELVLDTAKRTATVVWQYRHTPQIYSFAMGYVERLHNGNTFISWGADSTTYTEVDPQFRTVSELRMDNLNYTYRATKFEFDTVPVIRDTTKKDSTVSRDSTTASVAQSSSSAIRVQAAYPNPASTLVTLHFTLSTASQIGVELLNGAGQVVMTSPESVYPAGERNLLLDVSHLPDGAYFARITIGKTSETRSLVVQH